MLIKGEKGFETTENAQRYETADNTRSSRKRGSLTEIGQPERITMKKTDKNTKPKKFL